MAHNEAAVSYDAVTRQRKDDRSSQQVAFRHFNNFVKKTLIQFAMDRVAGGGAAGEGGVAVLDIASGRGGDVGKWVYAQSRLRTPPVTTSTYDCYDVSPECIAEAERRFRELGGASAAPPPACSASFTVADCFSAAFLKEALPAAPLYGRYHVVTIQFAFHYACHSPAMIRDVLAAVSGALAPGGVVLITTVDADVLAARAAANTLGNELYHITFPEPPQLTSPAEGPVRIAPCTEYHFKLDGFVDCTEYAVPMDVVTSAAREAELEVCPEVTKTFADFVHEYAASWKLNKGNKLSPAERELVTLYRSICFEKRRV